MVKTKFVPVKSKGRFDFSKKTSMPAIVLRLDASMHDKILQISKENDSTMTNVTLKLLEVGLEEYEKERGTE